MFKIDDIIFDQHIPELNQEMVTGVVGAMDSEISLLRDAMQVLHTETVAGMVFYQGYIHSHPLVLVRCGVGKVNAAVCAQTLILRYGVERVINIGVAGALDRHVNLGDIIISTDTVQHDFDLGGLSLAEGEPAQGAIRADPELRQKALRAARTVAANVQVFEGRICSGDQFIAGHAKKQAIVERHGGLCCEMEGAAVAQTCSLNEVPFVIIRAVSDKADDSGKVSFSAFADAVARRSAAIVIDMLENFHN